ncbi:MAG: type IV pili methyl-accepting chemotaxis transducer N-terminal domain-containing protein [Pseudomonadota bacterium]
MTRIAQPVWIRTAVATAAAVVLGLALSPSIAADTRTESGSARLSLAGKLRLETEVVSRLACEAATGADRQSAAADLRAAERRVRTFLSALKDGDLALGLREPEQKRRVLEKIIDVENIWRDVRSAVDGLLGGGEDPAALEAVLAAGTQSEAAVQDLLAVLAGSYSSGETFSFQASLALNVLLRQKVILAEIATLQCLIRSGRPTVASAGQLALVTQVETFENSLKVLIEGQPAIGIMPPPNDQVQDRLLSVADIWQTEKRALNTSASFGDTAQGDLLRELENAVVLYLLATSAQPDLYRVPLEQYTSAELRNWLRTPMVADAIEAQNSAHKSLQQDDVDALDQKWRAERASGALEMISEVMARPLSSYLKERQTATAGIVTEVFVMDNKGLNVGQSEITSDYWQGDEDKWLLTFATPEGEMHISDVEFDESTGFYQVQVSIPISSPDTGQRIGAVTFGVNIQSLL